VVWWSTQGLLYRLSTLINAETSKLGASVVPKGHRIKPCVRLYVQNHVELHVDGDGVVLIQEQQSFLHHGDGGTARRVHVAVGMEGNAGRCDAAELERLLVRRHAVGSEIGVVSNVLCCRFAVGGMTTIEDGADQQSTNTVLSAPAS